MTLGCQRGSQLHTLRAGRGRVRQWRLSANLSPSTRPRRKLWSPSDMTNRCDTRPAIEDSMSADLRCTRIGGWLFTAGMTIGITMKAGQLEDRTLHGANSLRSPLAILLSPECGKHARLAVIPVHVDVVINGGYIHLLQQYIDETTGRPMEASSL